MDNTQVSQDQGSLDVLIRSAEKMTNDFIIQRAKLVELHQKIGQLLGATQPSTTQQSSQRRQASPDTENAKRRIMDFLRENALSGASRGDISKRLSLDTSIVGRVLSILYGEGLAEMRGERRSARWFVHQH